MRFVYVCGGEAIFHFVSDGGRYALSDTDAFDSLSDAEQDSAWHAVCRVMEWDRNGRCGRVPSGWREVSESPAPVF